MHKRRSKMLTGALVVFAALMWGNHQVVWAGAGPQGKGAQGQTPTQKRQLAADRQAAAKKATAEGLTIPAFGTAALAVTGSAPHYFSMANWANSPLPLSYGNDVVARTTPTDLASNVFVVDTAHPLPFGTLMSFSYFADQAAAGTTFNAYVLRPTTTPDNYDVIFDSGPIASTGSGLVRPSRSRHPSTWRRVM